MQGCLFPTASRRQAFSSDQGRDLLRSDWLRGPRRFGAGDDIRRVGGRAASDAMTWWLRLNLYTGGREGVGLGLNLSRLLCLSSGPDAEGLAGEGGVGALGQLK